MTASIAIFGWMFLGLATVVCLERTRCYDDDWWTSGNVLAGQNTPVYSLRYLGRDSYSNDFNVGYRLDREVHAMFNLTQKSPWYGESAIIGTDVNNECPQPYVNPKTIYPKIVVVVDYKLYKRYDEDLSSLLEYLMAVWTGVDLNFRSLNDPKLRLNIAGIVVADHPNGLSFITERLNEPRKGDIREAGKFFSSFIDHNADYWRNHFGRYHIAVLMGAKGTHWLDNDSKAFSLRRGSCKGIDTTGPPTRIVFTDDGSWSRITRELTDFVAASFEIGSPHANHWDVVTSWNRETEYTERKPIWGPSRLNVLKRSLNSANAFCYKEKPVLSSPLPRVLPGKILDCDNQCKTSTGEECCPMESGYNCMNLGCRYHAWGFIPAGCQSYGMYAADGTSCSKDGKVCYRRECVFENEIR